MRIKSVLRALGRPLPDDRLLLSMRKARMEKLRYTMQVEFDAALESMRKQWATQRKWEEWEPEWREFDLEDFDSMIADEVRRAAGYVEEQLAEFLDKEGIREKLRKLSAVTEARGATAAEAEAAHGRRDRLKAKLAERDGGSGS
jgi:hypothetical protein